MSETPKDETFRHITCEKLTVKRPGRQSRVEVSINNVGAYIAVYGRSATNPLIQLYIEETGIGVQEGTIQTYVSDGFSATPKGPPL